MIKKGVLTLLGTLLILSGTFTSLQAQSPCTISMDVEQTSLDEILASIRKSCGISFNFDPDLLASYKVEQLKVEDVSWENALLIAIGKHPLHLVSLSDQQYALQPALPQSPPPPGALGMVSGTIRSGFEGIPLPGTPVALLAQDGAVLGGQYTDSLGQFSILYPKDQAVSLQAKSLGYELAQFALQDHPGPFDIRLREARLQMESVIINEESQSPLTASSDRNQVKVSPRFIDAISVLGEKDVFRTLQFLPGVSSTEESSNGVYVRGSTPDQTLVLIDGIPVYNTGHFFGMFHAFNAEALQKVEISRGGFDVTQGGAVAGLIEIESKPRLGDSLSAKITANLAATSAYLSLPFKNKRGAIMVAGRRSYADVIQSPLYKQISGNVFQTGSIYQLGNSLDEENEDGYELAPLSNFHDVHAKAVYDLGAGAEISASYYNGRDIVSYEFFQENEAEDESRTSSENLSLVNNAGGINFRKDFSPGKTLTARAYYTSYRGLFSTDQQVNEINDSISFFNEQNNAVTSFAAWANYDWEPKPGHQFSTGLQLTQVESSFELNYGEENIQNLDSISLISGIHSAWLGYTFKAKPRFELSPGIRLNYYGLDQEFLVEPRLQGLIDLGKSFKVNFNAGAFYQYLNPVVINNSLKLGTDFLALPNDESGVDITRSLQSGLGLTWLKPGIWIDFQLYAKYLSGLGRYTQNFDLLTNGTEINDRLSEGEAYIVGSDILIRGHVGPWLGWVSYTLSQVNHLFPDLNSKELFPADHDHRHEVKLVNTFQTGKWEFSLMWVVASGKPYSVPVGVDSFPDGNNGVFLELRYDQINSQRLPAYHRLDANVSYALPSWNWASMEVGLSFFNVYNRQNIRDRNYSVQYPEEEDDPIEIVRVDRELLGLSPNVFLRMQF